MAATTDQAEFWNGPGGERWVREQAERDAMLASYGEAAMAAARVADGDAVLDVGCGCGTTSLTLGGQAGPRGRVRGIDLSAPMIARATELAAGRGNVRFAAGDATTMPLDRGAFDVLFSRFGVMFFPDPVAAFTNLRGALKRDARLAFVCWRSVAQNPWASLPFEAAVSEVGAPPPAPADAPGPFAFASPDRVRSILAGAGFGSIDVAAFDSRASFGDALDAAALRVVTMGPATRLLGDAPPEVVARVVAKTRAAIAPFATDAGVVLPGAAWIVTARAV